jgi:hypothetical protein
MHGDHRVNRLKLHELQVLLAAAQAGSMAKAAAQLAMSEPAVSRSISDMERTLGAFGAAIEERHGNALAIAPSNKLARIAWSVLANGRIFEARAVREDEMRWRFGLPGACEHW